MKGIAYSYLYNLCQTPKRHTCSSPGYRFVSGICLEGGRVVNHCYTPIKLRRGNYYPFEENELNHMHFK